MEEGSILPRNFEGVGRRLVNFQVKRKEIHDRFKKSKE